MERLSLGVHLVTLCPSSPLPPVTHHHQPRHRTNLRVSVYPLLIHAKNCTQHASSTPLPQLPLCESYTSLQLSPRLLLKAPRPPFPVCPILGHTSRKKKFPASKTVDPTLIQNGTSCRSYPKRSYPITTRCSVSASHTSHQSISATSAPCHPKTPLFACTLHVNGCQSRHRRVQHAASGDPDCFFAPVPSECASHV